MAAALNNWGYSEDRLLATPVQASKAKTANGAGWRLVVATLALMAFAFQSFATQTHIHANAPASAASKPIGSTDFERTKGAVAAKNSPTKKTPASDDPLKCPLCQAVSYAGHFVAPSASALLLLPSIAISVLPLAIAERFPRQSPSHIWQGRGPPNS